MVLTSLAAQLSQGVSQNAPLLADRSRRRHTESYLFTSREADQQDFQSLHALGVNGLSRLKALDARFSNYHDNLFSDVSRDMDRTLQSESQNAELDRTLGCFLRDLGPYLLETPTSKALEWLIRRFRANEFNIDGVMTLFLPYHETTQFAKMLSILHVKESHLWAFLSPLKATAKPLPRSFLVDGMVANMDLARFIVELLPKSLGAGQPYRTLIGFTASVITDYLTRMKEVPEEVVAFLLPACIRTFAPDSNQDCALAGYVSLATLSPRCRFSPKALIAILSEMIKGQPHVKTQHILPFLVAVVGPQDALNGWSDLITDSIVLSPGFTDTLNDSLLWIGIEKLILPSLPSLIRRANDPISGNILDSLLRSPSVPTSVIERFMALCLDHIMSSSAASSTALLGTLSLVFQQHDIVFSRAFSKRLADTVDRGDRETLEGILRSATLLSSNTGDHGEWILSSNAADASSRRIAVRDLIKALATGDAEAESCEPIYDALRARVVDTDVSVIESLYSGSETILPILCNLPFIAAVSRALAAPDISRPIMRLHFAFVAGKLCGHNPELAPAIFEHIYLPFLLFTKPRQKTAVLVWQSLQDSKVAQYELFAGCTDIMSAYPIAEGTSPSVEQMIALNLAMTKCIADNIVASNVYPRHLEMLLLLLKSSDAHTTNICYLILRCMLNQLSGEHQVDAAYRILSSMGLQSFDELHGVMQNVTSLGDVISDETVLKSVVLKPSSVGTMHRLQIAILALLPVVPRPVDAKIDWLGDGPLDASDTRGKHFVQLARSIYILANTSSAAHFLSTSLLRALFVNLREHALLFLAGVWTVSLLSDMDTLTLPLAALFHGAAFLRAQMASTDHQLDFQVMVPSLLIALRSSQRAVRLAATDCITIISQCSSSTISSPTVYALDSVYKGDSDCLQYLEWPDVSHFVSSLDAKRECFINDHGYLGVFSQESLCKAKSDNKKEVGYKHRVLCYLLSHAIAWTSLRARVALLKILKTVRHRTKLQMLLPFALCMVASDQLHLAWDKEDKSVDASCLQLILEAFDETAIPELTEPGSESWIAFVRLVRFAFTNESAPSSARNTIVRQLCGGLFDSLTLDLQREICITLIESAVIFPDSSPRIKEAIVLLPKKPLLISSLLGHYSPTKLDTAQRAPKRPKLNLDSEMDSGGDLALRPMTIFVEILVAHAMPGSVELMSSALDALTRVCHAHSSQSDTNYLMQLLMSVLESIASSIDETAALAPDSVRMGILVELLRVVDNPQTFNQTLLLIANLARLAPDFVMQNVMPVFTFMGSNVFHRDDSYTFRVVQKTVDSVVPVVVASLRAKHPGSLELQIASREFLRVFTDAATHIPRHRRTKFFNHLVDVLDHEEFTVSICLLLVDKVTNRVVRQKSSEAANALSLPLTVLQTNFKANSFKVIEQLLQEAMRLSHRIMDLNSTVHDAFLELPQDEDETSFMSTKRQIQAILIFVELVLQQSSRKSTVLEEIVIQKSVQLLLCLVNFERGSITSSEPSEVSKTALKVLSRLLRVISAREFASAIATIIVSTNATIEIGALDLLASRLVNVVPKTRQDISPIVTRIVEHICEKLKASQNTFPPAAFKALCAIAQTAGDLEAPALTKSLPLVLKMATDQPDLIDDILPCVLPLSTKIGPRVLPFFRDVIELCSGVLRRLQVGPNDDCLRSEQDAQAVLIALLSSMSQFWGIDELVQLSELSLSARPVFLQIRKTMAKRIPTTQILPTLFRLWSKLTITQSLLPSLREAFFDLFKRVLRKATRHDVHDHIRDIFRLFIEAFDMSGVQGQGEEKFEILSVTAFVDVVTKLNDATFKPLFRRLLDWAFNDTTAILVDRQIIFCQLLTALIKLLKGLVTPYMGIALVPVMDVLNSYRVNRSQPERLWMVTVELLRSSLIIDEGVFWKTDPLRKLIPTVVAQVEVCLSFHSGDARQAFKFCLSGLVAAMDDHSSLKVLNLELLMQTRSDDAQVRMFTLECAEHSWDEHGEKLSDMVTDIVTFIAECADDEHDGVAKAARKLRGTVEKRCGSLDVLMQ